MRARLRYLPLLLMLMLLSPLGHAQKDRELEGWQKRVIEALEKAGESRDGESQRGERERQSLAAPGGQDPGASAAAARAQEIYGGRPLAVVRAGKGYRVRLLLDDGRVTTVEIRN